MMHRLANFKFKTVLEESVLLQCDWSLCMQFPCDDASYHRRTDSSTLLLWRSKNLQQRKCLLVFFVDLVRFSHR